MSEMERITKFIDKYIYELAFVLTAGATMASMILSIVLTLPPCQLCWYQRIFMFPLPAIYFISIIRRDAYAYLYAWPIALVGWAIAGYQTLLQWDVFNEGSTACSLVGPSCAEPEINIFGFLTIPFGSFLIFSAINVLMWRAYKLHHSENVITKDGANRALNLLVVVAALATLAVAFIRVFNVEIL